MATFDVVRTAVGARLFRISDHADDEMTEDDLSVADIVWSTLARYAEVIEDYPSAFPYPACLVLSRLTDGGPVHLVWAFEASSGYAVLVTVYRPDPARWTEDFRMRAKQ